MIINRIADVFFIFCIVLVLIVFKSVDYVVVFNLIPLVKYDVFVFLGLELNIVDIICIFLLIGCVGKSAQIGFHV
jgi:NADH-quinone oxidoreductase subunit L